MSEFFSPISETEDIRQGDVIRSIGPYPDHAVILGVIVTADCDIANRKASERYSWLEIVTMKDYIDDPWASDQLRKIVEKQGKATAQALNGHIKRLGLGLSSLESQSVCDWLLESTADEVLKAVTQQSDITDVKTRDALKALRVALGFGTTDQPLTRLMSAWTLLGQNERKHPETIAGAFNSSGGFQDFFVLPELPRTTGFGFVVKLRAVSSLMAQDLYLTEQDARINDKPHAFHRLGRLNDRVRFAITQKLAFLFSRIGMATTFESACEAATDLMIEDLFKAHTDKVRHDN